MCSWAAGPNPTPCPSLWLSWGSLPPSQASVQGRAGGSTLGGQVSVTSPRPGLVPSPPPHTPGWGGSPQDTLPSRLHLGGGVPLASQRPRSAATRAARFPRPPARPAPPPGQRMRTARPPPLPPRPPRPSAPRRARPGAWPAVPPLLLRRRPRPVSAAPGCEGLGRALLADSAVERRVRSSRSLDCEGRGSEGSLKPQIPAPQRPGRDPETRAVLSPRLRRPRPLTSRNAGPGSRDAEKGGSPHNGEPGWPPDRGAALRCCPSCALPARPPPRV